MIEINGYLYFYDTQGHLNCVNDAYTGATVYIPNSPDYTTDNIHTAAFFATAPDLSDRTPTPITEPSEPSWNAFLDELPGDVLVTIAHSAMAPLITARMAVLQTIPSDWRGEGDRLLVAWNASPPILSEDQRETLNHLATHHAIPLLIGEDNQLSV
jgi:hypothetical protein